MGCTDSKDDKPPTNTKPTGGGGGGQTQKRDGDAGLPEGMAAPAAAKSGFAGDEDYANSVKEAIKAEVFMFSGCMDQQCSADVSNVAAFGLPPDNRPDGAGGACTNALLAQVFEPGEESWIQILCRMQKFLKKNGYDQVPQLSASHKLDLSQPFAIAPGSQSGKKRALLIGINYVDHEKGQLSGCVNDVVQMLKYIRDHEGFPEDDDSMRILVDIDHDDISLPMIKPTQENIRAGIKWLIEGAQAGDSLFLHYSGHGAQQPDTSGDEEDGMDETLCPCDYDTAGMITDDELYETLVAPPPAGVRLTCLMDCCHSGTILDLPYTIEGNDKNLSDGGQGAQMEQNSMFGPQFKKLLRKGISKFGGEYKEKFLTLADKFGFI